MTGFEKGYMDGFDNQTPNNTTNATPTGKQRSRHLTTRETDVDIIFCIDVTGSMQPFIDSVKKLAMNLYDDLVEALAGKQRLSRNFRAKVIAFRDYYDKLTGYDLTENEVPGYVLQQSEFYDMTDINEAIKFSEFVASLEADGGGDEPESALEAMALAMKSLHFDGCRPSTDNESARHIIVVCTDASAHALDCGKEKPNFYPEDIPDSLSKLKEAWEGVAESQYEDFNMDQSAKRLVLYTTNSYPWTEIARESPWKLTYPEMIAAGEGGKDLSTDTILKVLAGSVAS